MLAVYEIRQYSVHGSVKLIESLNRAIVVRVAKPLADEPTMIEDIVGDKRFLMGHVLLLHGAFPIGIDETLMSDQISRVVENKATNAGSPFAHGREQFLQLFVKVTQSEVEPHDGDDGVGGTVQ